MRKTAWYSLAYTVLSDAYNHFHEDDGWAMASHVALSGLLALFPFLIFGTALAGFLGASSFSSISVHLLFDAWPAEIADPLQAEIQRVLEIPRGGLLTVSVLAAAYFASNGVEALRISLNRAYRVSETRTWYVTRLASLGYVVVVVVVFAVISILLVAVPVALRFAGTRFPNLQEWLGGLMNYSTYGIYGTVAIVVIGLIASHKWLPAGSRRLVDILPGALLTIVFWAGGAFAFASYLSTFATYAATYAGLASVMIVLVFLYMVGVIFMLGAEVNAALMKYRVYSVVTHHLRTGEMPGDIAGAGGRDPADAAPKQTLETDKVADIGR